MNAVQKDNTGNSWVRLRICSALKLFEQVMTLNNSLSVRRAHWELLPE